MGTLKEPAENWQGRRLAGRYTLQHSIGSGGMGAVYEATQDDLGRKVAVKLLHPHLAKREDLLTRFKREAMAAAALGHPNIVQVTDFCHAPGEPAFLVMERLEGMSLKAAIVQAKQMSARRAAFVTAQALSALEAAHAVGIIHRDLKPENIFLTSISGVPDIVKLLDFGLAKHSQTEEPTLTETGAVLGTPAYMAPEQIRADPVTPATDVYAMGAVLYHALTGRMPFVGDNQYALMYAVCEAPPTPLASIRPELDPQFVAVVEKAMSKDPAQRFADAQSMSRALAPFVSGASLPEPTRSGSRKGWSPSPSQAPSILERGPTSDSDLSTIAANQPSLTPSPPSPPTPAPQAPHGGQGHANPAASPAYRPMPPGYSPHAAAAQAAAMGVAAAAAAGQMSHRPPSQNPGHYAGPGHGYGQAQASVMARNPLRAPAPVTENSPMLLLGKFVGWGLLGLAAFMFMLVPAMCVSDSEAALGGVLLGSFFALPGGLTVGLIRHHTKSNELRNRMVGFIWSHDAFTAAELSTKIGKSEAETERLINGLSRSAGIPLLFHASGRRYFHPSRIQRKHAVLTRCQSCGALISKEIVFEGETRRCNYCDSPALSLPPAPGRG